MGENSKKTEIGEINQDSYILEVITWKIPNVSSILFAVDYGVQSPPFSFAGASWILEIYFLGQSSSYKGYIDVIIQRLHSEIEVHNFSCKIFCKNVFGEEFKPECGNVSFHSKQTRITKNTNIQNIQENYYKWEVAPNDTFTIVYEIQYKKAVVENESAEQISGEYYLGIITLPIQKLFKCNSNNETIRIPNTIKYAGCYLSYLCPVGNS